MVHHSCSELSTVARLGTSRNTGAGHPWQDWDPRQEESSIATVVIHHLHQHCPAPAAQEAPAQTHDMQGGGLEHPGTVEQELETGGFLGVLGVPVGAPTPWTPQSPICADGLSATPPPAQPSTELGLRYPGQRMQSFRQVPRGCSQKAREAALALLGTAALRHRLQGRPL